MVVVFLSVLIHKKWAISTKLIKAKRFEHQFVFALPIEGFIVTIEYQSFCPFVEIGSPHPLPFNGVCLLPWTQMGGATLTFGWEGEGTQFGRLDRNPGTLYTLCPAYFSLRKRSSGPLDHERSNERGHLFFSQPLRNTWEKTLIYSWDPNVKEDVCPCV